MIKVVDWLINNWKWLATVMTLLVVLSIVGSLTTTLRGAKKGLSEIFTPLGFIVLVIVVIIIIILVISLTKAIN